MAPAIFGWETIFCTLRTAEKPVSETYSAYGREALTWAS